MDPKPYARSILEEAITLQKAGDAEKAETLYRKVLTLDPNEPNAWHLLGVLAWQRHDLEKAEEHIRKAIALHANAPSYYNNLGGVLKQRGDLKSALQNYEKALDILPSDPMALKGVLETLHAYGKSLSSEDKWDKAKALYERGLALDPSHKDILNSLSELMINQGDVPKAACLLDRLLDLDPKNFIARFNRGVCFLTSGSLLEGWTALVESAGSWLQGIDKRINLPWLQIPLWDGSDLKGKKILLWGDPGIGDEILFGSMIPDLLSAGADITLECTDRLKPLFARSFPDIKIIARKASPEKIASDWQSPGLLLGRWLRPSFSSFRGLPYLKADPDKVAVFRERYKAFGKKKIIGLSWHSKTEHWGAYRRLPLIDILKALPLKDVLFIDLQYGDTKKEREEANALFGDLTFFHDDEVDQLKDMDLFAAQISSLDGVITIANTTPHLSGALGVKSAVLLPEQGLTWYWFQETDTSPWYKSLDLLRPDKPLRMEGAASFMDNLLENRY